MPEVLILAAITIFVLFRLYIALGRDDGPPDGRTRPEPGSVPQPAAEPVQAPSPVLAPEPEEEPHFTGPAAGGLEEIYHADKSFSPRGFLQGARAAYELIVEAFADGNRGELRPMLDDDVYEAWDAAIARREADGSQPWRLLRIKRADIESAELDGDIARVTVRYEAELGDGERVKTAREIWTFMRNVTSSDPNWLLDDVEIAS